MPPMDFMSAGSFVNSNLMRPRSHVNSLSGISEWQEYDQKLSDIATAALEQRFADDLKHVDHWFGLLTDTEQMAVLYTLLQHCSQNNARFFIMVLQQMIDRRHPRSRTSDLIEDHHRPYPISRSSTTTLNNRHSIAFGDSPPNLFSPLFGSTVATGTTTATPSTTSSASYLDHHHQQQQRPRSVIDNSSTFLTPAWNQISTPNNKSVIGDRRTIARPKSADVSTWWDPSKHQLGTATTTTHNIPGTVLEADEQQQQQQRQERKTTSLSSMVSDRESLSSSGQSSDTSIATTPPPQTATPITTPVTTTSTTTSTVAPAPTTQQSPSSSVSSSRKLAKTPKEKRSSDTIDMELVKDIPAFLKSLRLHKYNPIFESMKWQDMIKLSNEQLEAKGVAALGARRKMMTVFENIRSHCHNNNIPY
ncbi:hypothetical protein BDA99DRAFT_94990 [Phascolomyces articulosus]|uniref:SAM domain-containing protein n=1 Tax=Phascolomyces articulosus TaxID=60185 RepID=A0AAD5JY54_9FUNG|nr:hypothetical protein BDA99DRAFT_94990 [Phascolomyces articulosus]